MIKLHIRHWLPPTPNTSNVKRPAASLQEQASVLKFSQLRFSPGILDFQTYSQD